MYNIQLNYNHTYAFNDYFLAVNLWWALEMDSKYYLSKWFQEVIISGRLHIDLSKMIF